MAVFMTPWGWGWRKGERGANFNSIPLSYLGSYGILTLSVLLLSSLYHTGQKVSFDSWIGGIHSIVLVKIQAWMAKWQQQQGSSKQVRSGYRARLYNFFQMAPTLKHISLGEHFTNQTLTQTPEPKDSGWDKKGQHTCCVFLEHWHTTQRNL